MCLLGGCTIAGLAPKNLKTKARSKRAHQCLNGPAPQIFRWEEPPHDYLRKPSLWTTVL
jgi:hypothetical protein